VDRSQRLSGELDRTTLELPADHNAEDGFRFYKDQLNRLNLRELFHCKARDCGTSNSWANIHFKIIQLYGLDQYQFYAAYEITNADENPFYVVLYSVMRGNKRAYVQVEILHVNKANEFGVASSPETLNKLLDSNGYFVFPDLIGKDSNGAQRIQVKKAHVQALAALLSQQPKLKLAFVGHDYSVATVEEQQKKSAQIAKQVKQALVDAGVGENRLQTYGVGGLAPAGRGDKNARVEIVKLIEN
jgi:outer membrane protein OmpA-like peptidoglycan-associated protein